MLLYPQGGELDVNGTLLVNDKFPVTQEILDNNLFSSKYIATEQIDPSYTTKIIVNSGYSNSVQTGSLISSYDQIIIGLAINTTAPNSIGILKKRGIFIAKGFNCSNANIGDKVYCTDYGNLTLAYTPKLIGIVVANTNPGVLYINIAIANNINFVETLARPGVVFAYLGVTAPNGYLLCDGNAYIINDYIGLYDIIGTNYGTDGAGTFRTPNYSGMFFRGVGIHGSLLTANGSLFTGPALHTSQLDAMQDHKHNYDRATASTLPMWKSAFITSAGVSQTNLSFTDTVTDTVNGTPREGNETRAVNYGVNFIIKT